MLAKFGMIKTKLVVLMLLPFILLSGCIPKENIIRMDLQVPVINLDPQFTTESAAQMLIMNLFEGLVVQTPQGDIIPGCAESWEISDDDLRYTFNLRENLYWSDDDKTPITADDFVFGISRLFAAPVSPHAAEFIAIKGAKQRIAGSSYPLGVEAPNEHTLVITLEQPDPTLLAKLAGTAAMPCNRKFFESCRGRYGLDQNLILSNGPFALQDWNNEKHILIQKNKSYHSPDEVVADMVYFYTNREDSLVQFENNKSQVILLPQAKLDKLKRSDISFNPAGNTIWCLVINTKDSFWRLPILRQALAFATNREPLAAEGIAVTELILPEGILIGESDFFQLVDTASPVGYAPKEAQRLFALGLSALELDLPPALTILTPDSAEQMQYMGALQQIWQRELSLYPRIQRLPGDALYRRVAEGDFQAALLPFETTSEQVADMLELFAKANNAEYKNTIYNSFVADAQNAVNINYMAQRYAQAQRLLLADAPIIPLYEEITYYVTANSVKNLWVYPFSGNLYFKYAEN